MDDITIEKYNRSYGPRTGHLTIPTSASCRVVCIHNSHLLPALIGLAECITTLFPHALYLADFADRLLKLLHSWPVILYVVLLDLLDMVIGLRQVHALRIFPRKVAGETESWQDNSHQVELRYRKYNRNNALVFPREADGRSGISVSWQENQPNQKRARNRHDVIFRPNGGDERCFSEYGDEDSRVQTCTPNPVSSRHTILLFQIIEEEKLRNNVSQE